MQTFLISMKTPSGAVRRKRMETRLHEAGVEGVEWVVGVNGKTLSPEEVADAATPMCARFCTPGIVGCALSHMKCWRLVVERGLSHALILEDDAKLEPGFREKLEQGLAGAPKDYHVILAGCFFLCSDAVQRVISFNRLPEVDGPDQLRRIRMFGGTHAYVISNAGARYLLEQMPKVWFHVDLAMGLVPGLRVFRLRDLLAVQDDMQGSSIAQYGFPGTINAMLHPLEQHNLSPLYLANVAYARIGPYAGPHVVMTPWHFMFLLTGVLGVPWRYFAAFAAVDMALFPPTDVLDTASKIAAFAVGFAARRYM